MGELRKEKMTGRCFRHRTKFVPSPQFDNNCPACYWELQYSNKAAEHSVQSDGICTCAHVERPMVDKDGICFSCHQPRR